MNDKVVDAVHRPCLLNHLHEISITPDVHRLAVNIAVYAMFVTAEGERGRVLELFIDCIEG